MITLNLISETEKKILKERRLFIITKSTFIILLVTIVIFTVVLFFDKLLLNNKLKTTDSEIKSEESFIQAQQGSTLEKSIKELNSQLQTISNIEKNHINWNKAVAMIVNLVPANIQISSLVLDKDSQNFNLNGQAKTRDSLLVLQHNLESSKSITNLITPITNLTEKENISFEYTGQLNYNSEAQ